MKTNFNYFVLSVLFCLFTSFAHAQLIGGGENGQSPTASVSASAINAGGISGDVNLFTGTYSSSYSLGSVSTPSGLGYAATLSYSSNFSAGDNLPHTTGIPYGEGWTLNMPTLTVSVEDYNKYTLQEIEWINRTDGWDDGGGVIYTPTYDCDEALEEGRLYWFAPKISIPGVGGGRMVFKERRGDVDVFVLNKFERYIEAHFDGRENWKIITDDGTEYEMTAMVISHRNASNQRADIDCSDDNAYQVHNLTKPKTEILGWYCTRISHPNKSGEILFTYEKYGCFNFFKQYKHQYFNCDNDDDIEDDEDDTPIYELLKVCKDIYLSEINSGFEKLVLDYTNILDEGVGGYLDYNIGEALLDPAGGDNSEFVDNLYRSQVVDEWSGNSFSGWNRYMHGRAADLDEVCPEYSMVNKTNPYLINAGELGYLRQPVSGSAGGVTFNHGFLESPDVNESSFYPGDTYEIFSTISNYQSAGPESLFDFNLVSGDRSYDQPGQPLGGYEFVSGHCFQTSRSERVYSTFNQAYKWQNYDATMLETSNFFVMPCLPFQFNELNLQIGPANSDNDFIRLPDDMLLGGTDDVPFPGRSYFNNYTGHDDNGSNLMQSGDGPPNNFGIGIPWYLMDDAASYGPFGYGAYMDYVEDAGETYDGLAFWWNDYLNLEPDDNGTSCGAGVTWRNMPTRMMNAAYESEGNHIKLGSVGIKRYAKSPYMLHSVKHFVRNGSNNMVEVNNLSFRYDIQRLDRYVSVQTGELPGEVNIYPKGYRNVVKLTNIRQMPFEVDNYTDAEEAPTTTFGYDVVSFVGDLFGNTDCIFNYCPGGYSADFSLLTHITNPLGKETLLSYLPLGDPDLTPPAPGQAIAYSYPITSFQYKSRPGAYTNSSVYTATMQCANNQTVAKKGPSFAYQIHMIVEIKRVKDRDGAEKVWNYSFSDRKAIDNFPYIIENGHFSWDVRFDFSTGFGNTTVTGPTAGAGIGPRSVFQHHTDYLLWGKMYNTETYDENNNKVSDSHSVYETVKAFDASWAYSNNGGVHPDMLTSSDYCTFDVPYFYETRYGQDIQSHNAYYLHSYFVKKNYTISKVWEGNNAITTTNLFEYFDRDYTGKSDCSGYEKMGIDKDDLTFEPSWQLYKVKTRSPHHDGYNIKEFFYLYDLANNPSYNYNGNSSNLGLLTNVRNTTHIRPLTFENRTTSFSPNDPNGENVNSTYNFYTTNFPGLNNKIHLRRSEIQVRAGTPQVAQYQGSQLDIPFETLVTGRVLERNSEGQVELSADERNLQTRIVYNSVGLPTSETIGEGWSEQFTTTYTYTDKNELETVTDPNQMLLEYTYDDYGRLVTSSRNGQLIQETGYSNWNSNDVDLSFTERAAFNFVTTTNHVEPGSPGPAMSWTDVSYVDPLGRNLENQLDGVSLGATIFDIFDRPILSLRPGESAFGGMPANPEQHMEMAYEVAPRNWVNTSSKYGESLTGDHVVTQNQEIVIATDLESMLTSAGQNQIPPGVHFFKSTVTDEDGKTVYSYSNAFGQTVATITTGIDASGPQPVETFFATVFLYNSFGEVSRSFNPSNQRSEYNYNYLGLLHSKKTVDADIIQFAYDNSGQLIGEDFPNGQTRLYSYDKLGRLYHQTRVSFAGGVFSDQGLPWIDDPTMTEFNDIFFSAESKFEKSWVYIPGGIINNNDNGLPANVLEYIENDLTYIVGRAYKTVSYDNEGKAIENRYFSYNIDGFLKWEMSFFNEEGLGELVLPGGLEGRAVRILYPEYNLQGSYKKMQVDINADHILDFQYSNTYDNQNRLKEVYVSYDDPDSDADFGYKMATYDYDPINQRVTHRKYWAAGEALDGSTCEIMIDETAYGYDLRERMTHITSQLFDWELFYDANQINGFTEGFEANFNGNVNATRGTYKLGGTLNAPPDLTWDESTDYNYKYDGLNRLINANRRQTAIDGSNSIPGAELFGDAEYTYDKIGNIQSLVRGEYNGVAGAIQQRNLSYTYDIGNNKLLTVLENGSQNYGTYTYDENGNLTSDTHRNIETVGYGRSNLPFSIKKDATAGDQKIKYLYDANDARIYKETEGGTAPLGKEYYIRNAGGQELAVFDVVNDNLVWYVYGLDRIAKIGHQVGLVFEKGLDDDDPKGSPECVIGAPDCTEAEQAAQEQTVQQVRSQMPNQSSNNLTYPTKLFRIRLCNGDEMNLLENELAQISGSYILLQEITINSAGQIFSIAGGGATNPTATLDDLLAARMFDEQLYVNNYEPCKPILLCEYKDLVNASSVISTTILRDSLGVPHHADYSNFPGYQNSLADDGVMWNLFDTKGLYGEMGWDIGIDFNIPNATITGYQVNYEIENWNGRNLTIRLHDGTNFINSNLVAGNGTIIFPPDQLPTLEQIKNMKLSMHLEGGTRMDIDVVSAMITYMAPCDCDREEPECADDQSEQTESLRDWADMVSRLDRNTVSYPTKMYRLRMCDGTEINALRQEMSMLNGTFKLLQKIDVTSPQQLFNIRTGGTEKEMAFEELLDVRGTDTGVIINDYDACGLAAPTTPPGTPPTDGPLGEVPDAPIPLATYFQYDHLGNTRVTYGVAINCETSIVSYVLKHVVDYYPYGKVLKEYVPTGGKEKFLTTYNERDQETGLDYRGARFYDSDVVRFLSLDPLASIMPAWSAYNYVFSNPVVYVDPEGLSPEGAINLNEVLVTADKPYWMLGYDKASEIFMANNGASSFEHPRPSKDEMDGSSPQQSGGGWLGVFQTTLDVIGMSELPIVSQIADLTNAGIHLYNGNYGEAMMSGMGAIPFVGAAVTAVKVGRLAKKSKTLFHYTTEAGYNAIRKSNKLNPSKGVKNARHGVGQYFTDIAPGTLTQGQVSRRLFRVPWNTKKITHFVEVEVSNLQIIKNKAHNFLRPSDSPLDLTGRIVDGGKSYFK